MRILQMVYRLFLMAFVILFAYPKEDSPIVWGKLITAVRADDLIPVWQHFYDEKGKLMRVLNFKEIVSFGGHFQYPVFFVPNLLLTRFRL